MTAVGTNSAILDMKHKPLQLGADSGHLSRVSSAALNGSIVATGSKDRNILRRDLRASSSRAKIG